MKLKQLWIAVLILATTISVQAVNPRDFELKSVNGQSVFNLSSAKGKYVALHFLLQTECPFCIRHTHEYITKASTLPNVIQVFIKPDTDEEIEQWARNFTDEELTQFPIYRDTEAQLANMFSIPDGYKFHNKTVHYPALILLNPKGKEVFRYIGKNNSDRFAFDRLKLKIEELTKH